MDITTNKSKKQYMFEEQEIDLGQSESQFKTSLFAVLFVLLKDQTISIYTSCLLAIIQCIHLVYFAFHDLTGPMWEYTDVTDVLQDIFGYFTFVFYMKNAAWNVYVAVLYIFLGITIFILLAMAYVNFAFSRRKSSFSWPVWIIKNCLLLFTTILFLPFTHYFVSILDCTKDYSGTYVHTYFSEVPCWTGAHIIHVCFAVIALVLFSSVSLVVSLTCFEYKNDQNNPSSRVSARPNFFLNVYQLITIICLTFFSGIESQILLLAIMVSGSALLFYQFHFNCPFHDEVLTKLWSILTALNLWTALMLVFAKVLEDVLFDGSVIAWLVALPFITYILYIRKDHRINLLLININKFKSPIEIQNQARYVQKLIQWEPNDSNAAILLKGYLEIHKKSCNKEDCPLKQNTAKNARFAKSLMNKGNEGINERYALFVQILYKTYAEGVAKFPKSVALRISYAFFLLERMNSKQQALQELLQAEQNKPSLDEEFIIYRYKKIIEDEIAESQNESQGNLDVVTELTFQTHLRQIQANIEKATLLYMEFWAQLTEETPDLAKLNDIGSKISAAVQTVEDNWVKLIKVNPNNPVAMKLYGKFLLEIINDKEGGDDLLEKSMKLATEKANKKTANVMEGNGDDDNHDVTPTIWMSGEHENLGIITGINLAAASLFGYHKSELMNRKVNIMMPDLLSQHHDSFIERYLNTGESSIIGKNKERLVFGKHKTEYIFPAFISLKSVQSIMQGIQFIATFRIEKNFKNTAYLLTNSEGVIDSMTSSCINILRIDQRAAARKANIQDYIPSIIKNRSLLFPNARASGKTSVTLQYTYPKDLDYVYTENDKTTVQLNCQLTDLVFATGKEVAGYQFRFDYTHERVVQPYEFNKNVKISNFQFRNDFEQPKASFVGEYVDSQKNSALEGFNDELLSEDVRSSMDPDGSFIRSDSKQVSDIWKVKPPPKKEEEEEHYEVKRTNYGVGIKTYKLYHGKPVDLDESKSSSDEESSEDMRGDQSSKNPQAKPIRKQEEASYVKEEEADADLGDLGNTFKSRKQLNTVVSDRTPPTTVNNLKLVVNLLCLALGLVALLDYILSNKEYNGIEKNIDLLQKANQNTAEFMNALAMVRNIYLYNIGVTNSIMTLTSLQSSMTNSLNAAKTFTQYLGSETDSLTSEHLSLLNDNVVTLTSQDGTTANKGLTQACQEVISRGFAYLTKSSTVTSTTDSDYYFLTFNLLNDVYIGLRESSMLYGERVNDKANERGTFVVILIASILILFIALLILFAIFYQINKGREEVLSLFLDIPEKTVKALFKKCETFITNLQIGDEEEVFSQVDDDDLDKTQADIKESDSHEFIPRKKRKHYKNSGRSQKAFFFKFIVLALVVEGFFLYNFISAEQLLNDISDQLTEFNATSQAEPFYSFASNTIKQLWLDKTFPIYNLDSFSVNTRVNKMMYDLDADILQLHAINRNVHTSTYSDVFNQIMMSNPCAYITGSGAADCSTYAGQSVAQGISVASTKYFEDFRVLQRCWLKVASGTSCAIDLVTNVSVSGFNSTQNLWFGLFLTDESIELSRLRSVYFKQTFRALITSFQDSLNTQFSNALTIKLVIFIVFLVILAVIYTLLWLPLLRKINNDIWRTKSMLSMIPLHVISKIKSVRVYLKKFWSNQNFSEL